MRKTGESRILYGGARVAGKVRDLFGKSVILQGLASLYQKIDTAFRQGRLGGLSDAEGERDARQYRFRTSFAHALENSLLARFFSRLSTMLLETSVGSFGAFGVLLGAFTAAVLLVSSNEAGILSTVAALSLCALSLPLLRSTRSLSCVICHSRLVGGLLFDFCGLSETRFTASECGRERYWLALFAAFLCGVLGVWMAPSRLFLAFVVLPAVWLLFASPELCTLSVLFGLPFLNLTAHPTVILTVGVLFCEVSWLFKALCGRKTLHFGLIDLLVLLFGVLYLFGGLIGTGDSRTGLTVWLLIGFWFPVRNLFSVPRWRARAFAALKWSGVIMALWGIGQYFFTDLELRWVDVSRFADIGGRVCASFSNPNVFAVFLLSVTPLFLADAMERRGAWRLLHFGGFALCCVCLILTWSRGAWLGIIFSTVLFLLCYSRYSAGALLLSSLPICCALPFLPHNIVNRFTSIGSFGESSIRYRIYTWRGVFRMLREKKWGIGVGSEAFYTVFPRYAVSGTERVMHTHQLWLQIWVELGIPGLAVFLLFTLLLTLCVMRGLRDLHGTSRAALLGSACAVVGVLTMGCFDYVWYHFGMCCLFFTLCGLTTAIGEGERA